MRLASRLKTGRVERWRGGLGAAYLFSRPFVCGCLTSCTMLRFHLPHIEPCVRISRTRLSDWLLSPAHDVSFHFSRDSEKLHIFAGKYSSFRDRLVLWELIGKANLRTVGLFQQRARSQAPFLHRYYPASTVLRACPPPHTAEPAPHGVLVESHDLSPLGFPVFPRSPPPCMPAPLPRRNRPMLSLSCRAATAFPKNETGRLPQFPFRGLLGVHSRSGLHGR